MKNIHLLIEKYDIGINNLEVSHDVFEVHAIIEMYVLLPKMDCNNELIYWSYWLNCNLGIMRFDS